MAVLNNLPTLIDVICLTYNQEKFIRDSVISVLNQQTQFEFRLLIFDDASKDNTESVISDIQKSHPNGKKIIYHKNQKNKGASVNGLFALQQSTSKYVALCEGDDYWTDPFKLQKQVDFLENNPDYVLCFTRGIIKNEFTKTETISLESENNWEISFEKFLQGNNQLTVTCIFRNNFNSDFPDWFKNSPFGDYAIYLHLMYYTSGKAICLKDITAIYRIHEGGTHGKFLESKNKLIRAYKLNILFYTLISKKITDKKYRDLIKYKQASICNSIMDTALEIRKYETALYFNFYSLFFGLGKRIFFENSLKIIKKALLKS